MKQDKYITREEYDKDYKELHWIISLFVIIIFVMGIWFYDDIVNKKIDDRLKDVPHKVCHNESVQGEYCVKLTSATCIGKYINSSSLWCKDESHICIPDKTQREVCEIK